MVAFKDIFIVSQGSLGIAELIGGRQIGFYTFSFAQFNDFFTFEYKMTYTYHLRASFEPEKKKKKQVCNDILVFFFWVFR
jgi:hypothetical protein